MKLNHPMQKWITGASLGLLLTASPSLLRAASDFPIALDSSLSAWVHLWGSAYVSMSYDSANSALEVQESWTASGTTAWDCDIYGSVVPGTQPWQFPSATAPYLDGSQYSSLELDIMFLSSSTIVLSTSGGGIQIGFDSGYGNTILTTFFPAYDGVFHHYSIPITGTEANLTKIDGVSVYCWQPSGATGDLNWEVKNVVFKAKVVATPPPTLATPEPVKATGLWLGTFAGGGGTRNSVHTTNTTGNGVSWVGVATPSAPVTYTMTIAQYPNSALYPGIQSHIFLSSDPANGEGAPEWNSTNAIFLRIMNHTNGSADATFMIKTNAPSTWGGQIFGTGNLATINSTTVTGKWSLTFSNDTNVTITAPDNTSTNFSLDPSYPPYFQYVFASFGIQQNTDTYGGRYVILSHVGITAPYGIDDYFTSGIPDSSFSAAGPPYGTQTVQPGAAWYAKWLVPASGFGLILSPNAVDWTDDPSTNQWTFDGYGWAPVPGGSEECFGMVKRVATKLQVLLPGETNAPNTLTGKVGTPDPQTLGNTFDLRINACDATWHIAPCSDTVAITSTDTSVSVPNTALVNGTVTISGFYFGNSGTQTITATDVTTSTISASTSSPITFP